MCAVKTESAVRNRRAIAPRLRRSNGTGDSVVPSKCYATLDTVGDFDSDPRWTIWRAQEWWQLPLLLEWLVQLFVVSKHYVPESAERLLDPTELPAALERVAMQAQHSLQKWFAWADGPRIWFFVLEIATVPSLYCWQRGLRLFFYDEEGRFVSWGTWALHSGGGWVLCER